MVTLGSVPSPYTDPVTVPSPVEADEANKIVFFQYPE